jgi:predicted ATPase/transcriptional regulator with XRE-family HTH domain
MVAFGARLRDCRRAAGLSQEELAERAGLSVRAISDLERGRTRSPYPNSARRLADALLLTDAARAEFIAAAGRRLGPVAMATTDEVRKLLLRSSVSALVGRCDELAEVPVLLAGGRLVTLVGAPGSGKTRLALEVAAGCADASREDVHLVRVDALSDRHVRDDIARQLAGRNVLLVLDNCEHVRESCARLIADLLDGCPRLRVLATSREPLGMAGERIYEVPALAVPQDDNLTAVAESDAGRLLIARATLVNPAFALTAANAADAAALCRAVDGIPLAIELAADRLRAFTLEQLVRRLDRLLDVLSSSRHSGHHRSLRAALDWSHDLLTAREQAVLARLAVFAGDFTLEAAETVASAHELTADDVFDGLSRLVECGLVMTEPATAEGMRYRLLEVVRQYASEKLHQGALV